ncbi:methyl-accepting chemotaxis protein [Pectinatus haikarae]|uniref:Methyl-accepting chemotaxis protein n=1 Tax=Pectinatus haikarae TaxID=349096 RepID=A0ABT9Y501_9FIRM|nr:HAMP domain-containing methyl-accepting chemotaxis protein [Pectinatus haikarae]MDQ0202909.1 methyl-accepting chemotaxis protein [Pectinatus haikarae]
MKRLADLKIKSKLSLLIFSVVIFLIIVGYTSHYSTQILSEKLNIMYTDRLQPIQLLNSARAESRRNEAITYSIFASRDSAEQQTLLGSLEEHKKIYIDFLDKFQQRTLDETEKNDIEKIKADTKIYREAWQTAISMAVAGNQEEAILYFKKNALQHLTDINKTLDDLSNYENQLAEQENQLGNKIASLNDNITLIITLAAIILSGGLGLLISRYISIPLHSLMEEVDELSAGDFKNTADNSHYYNDEIGSLGRAMGTMRSKLRELIKQIHNSAEQLAASSEELSASADQSAQTSDQVANSVTEVASGAEKQLELTDKASSTVKHISAAVTEVSSNTRTLANSAEKAAAAANDGEASIQQAMDQMKIIENKTNDTAAVIEELNARSAQISQIVDVISSIAGQTNLLALNAAIEAASAGEAGKGFAVVAEEVRRLAEQSQSAAKQITEIIGQIQKQTNSAVNYMNDSKNEVDNGTVVVANTGKNFEQILYMVKTMTEQILAISASVDKVTQHSRNVVDAVDSIDTESKKASDETQNISAATEEQSATVGEIASASGKLAKLAENLQAMVQEFKV